MRNRAQELADVRLDIETLRTMIDQALDNGAGSEDIFLRACAGILYERRRRLDELGSSTLYVSRGTSDEPSW